MYITINETASSNQYYAYTANYNPDPNKETIVFVHGTAMDHCVWALQSRYFAYHNYNILALDLPAHGLSGGDLLDSIEDMAAWLNQVLQVSAGTAFHLVGHSMGSLICLQSASTYKHSTPLKSLSLIGFSYPMAVNDRMLGAAKNNPAVAYSMMTQFSHHSRLGGEPNPGFWSPGMQMSMMENSRDGAVFKDLTACNSYANGEQALSQVSIPTLFLSGHNDKMAPAELAKSFAAQSSYSEVVLLPNCGHSIMSESPDGVRDALKTFINNN